MDGLNLFLIGLILMGLLFAGPTIISDWRKEHKVKTK